MSSEEQGLLVEIGRKLDVLVALTAAAGKEPDAQIEVLTSLGYGPGFIAPIVGLAPNAITKRISRKKKAVGRRRRKANE
jgi:hypothetical protein